MNKYEVEISTTKYITVEAKCEIDAENIVNEMPLGINDFSWSFITRRIKEIDGEEK